MGLLPAGYVEAPQYLITIGEPLRATLFIHMAANQALVRFREKGETLEIIDLPKLKSLQKERLLIQESEYQAMLNSMNEELEKEEAPSPPAPKAAAAAPQKPPPPLLPPLGKPGMINKVAATAIQDMGALLVEEDQAKITARINQTLEDGSRLLSDVMLRAQTTDKEKSSIEKYLQSLALDKSPIAAHNRHVSALAGLILLTFWKPTQQQLSDLVLAGIFHDVSLGEILPSFGTKHLDATDLGLQTYRTFAQEAVIKNYIQHIDLAIKRIEDLKIPLTPAARRILREHHENLDGSGLFQIPTAEIHPLSKILRLADDAIVLVQNPKEPRSLAGALDKLLEMNEEVGNVYYDANLLKVLLKLIKG